MWPSTSRLAPQTSIAEIDCRKHSQPLTSAARDSGGSQEKSFCVRGEATLRLRDENGIWVVAQRRLFAIAVPEKLHPTSVSIATCHSRLSDRSRETCAAPRPGWRAPEERQHSAASFGGTRDECPRREVPNPLARGIKARRAETIGSVHASPVRLCRTRPPDRWRK
jgi:hypothetical protein